jgi:hypothetical protein
VTLRDFILTVKAQVQVNPAVLDYDMVGIDGEFCAEVEFDSMVQLVRLFPEELADEDFFTDGN